MEECMTILSSSTKSSEEKLTCIDRVLCSYDAASTRIQEAIIQWIVREFRRTNKNVLLEKLLDILKIRGTNISAPFNTVTTSTLLSVIKNLEDDFKPTGVFLDYINSILNCQCVSTYLRQHEEECADFLSSVLPHLCTDSDRGIAILTSLAMIYQYIATSDNWVKVFLKKCLRSSAQFYGFLRAEKNFAEHGLKKKFLILWQVIVFQKSRLKLFSSFLESCFSNAENDPNFFDMFFKETVTVIESDLDSSDKTHILQLIVESYVVLDQADDTTSIRLAILIAHILGIEQKVLMSGENGERAVIQKDLTQIVGVPTYKSKNLNVWNGVLEVLSTRPLNLSGDLQGWSCLQWFQAWTTTVCSGGKITHLHIENLTVLLLLDSSIVEPSLMFKRIFDKAQKFVDLEFCRSYERLLMEMLTMSSKLQRVHKFIAKFVPTTLSLPSDMDSKIIVPPEFLQKLTSIATGLPSVHCSQIVNLLMDNLEYCISAFEDDKMSIIYLQVVAHLLNAMISGSKLFCYSLPRPTVESFISQIERLGSVLAKFSTVILMRPHVRSIMQPFLRVCFVWGEIMTLAHQYTFNEPLTLPKDSAPSDLSPLLTFINRDQWSVFAERIANFGDQLCNQLLMKLIIQKLRVASLHGDKSLINSETCASYLFSKLKRNVHNISIVQVMHPDEFDIIISVLPQGESKSMVSLLYSQLMNEDKVELRRWIDCNVLLENKKYVIGIFEAAIAHLLRLTENDVRPENQSLYKQLNSMATFLTDSMELSALRDEINNAFTQTFPNQSVKQISDEENFAISTLVSLPLTYLASKFGRVPLTIITGLMIASDLIEPLFSVFELLTEFSKDIAECFDIGLCIQFLTNFVHLRCTRAAVIENLIVRGTTTDAGAVQFKRFITSLKKDENIKKEEKLYTQVRVYNSIRKCFGRGKRSAEICDVLGKQRRRLVKGLRESLKCTDDVTDLILLEAYTIEFTILERKGKIADVAKLNFHSYLNRAIAGVKTSTDMEGRQSCFKFLTIVLKCARTLRTVVHDEFVYKIWNELRETDFSILWPHIASAASLKEFRKIMQDLLTLIKKSLSPSYLESGTWQSSVLLPKYLRPIFVDDCETPRSNQCPLGVNTWTVLMKNAEGKKQIVCQETLKELLKDSKNILPKNDDGTALLCWLKFLHFCATHKSVKMTSTIHNYIFDVLLATPEDNIIFLEHFIVRVDLLCVLSGRRGTYFNEKTQLIFLVFKRLLGWLIRESDTSVKLLDEQVNNRALAAFHLEKWASLLIQKDISKEVVFFIAEIIRSLALVNVYPPVKVHLNNCIFKLLEIVDDSNIQFLMRTLRPGSQEIFSSLHSQYQRFYKFRGKI